MNRSPLKRTPVKRGRRKPRTPMAGFWAAVTENGTKWCEFVGTDHDVDCDYWPTGKCDAHHYLSQNYLKRNVAPELLAAALTDPRNGVALDRFHHAQVENARVECPRPPELDGFLADFGLTERRASVNSYALRKAERDNANDWLGAVRQVTDEAGHQAVPFLDDAVKVIVDERDTAWERVRELEEFVARARPLLGLGVADSLGNQADRLLLTVRQPTRGAG